MTAKAIGVVLGVVATVVVAAELLDVARRSLTVAMVAAVAFMVGRVTGRPRPGEER